MAQKTRDLQVHFEGVDRNTGIDQTGYWGFGIIEDEPESGIAMVLSSFGDIIIDYRNNYTKLLEFWMAINGIDCPASLCTISYPFEPLATRR